MLYDLYKLFYKNKNGLKTPLEDFTTECFAGVLRQHNEVLLTYCDWIGLPKNQDYQVETQVRKYINDKYYIIDLVLTSSKTICFIENKVNSKEGYNQLKHYANLLDLEKKQTYLCYCTKRVETKNIQKHNFKQYRWYEVAKFLYKNHKDIPLVIDFIEFLKTQNMAQDNTITTDTVITLRNFLQTYETMDFHIDNVKPEFQKLFPKGKIEKQEKIPKIREFDRIAILIPWILTNRSAYSEILFAIHFENVKLQTQIWININHPQAELIKTRAKDFNKQNDTSFMIWEDNNGIGIYIEKKLYHFIGNENGDEEIKDWFVRSFELIRKFIDQNSDIEWDESVKKDLKK